MVNEDVYGNDIIELTLRCHPSNYKKEKVSRDFLSR